MSTEPRSTAELNDSEHLAVLGYQDSFDRSMSLWANFALGFTYLSPLVGVYSLFAVAMAAGGPPSVFWIFIVGAGQMLVAIDNPELLTKLKEAQAAQAVAAADLARINVGTRAEVINARRAALASRQTFSVRGNRMAVNRRHGHLRNVPLHRSGQTSPTKERAIL